MGETFSKFIGTSDRKDEKKATNVNQLWTNSAYDLKDPRSPTTSFNRTPLYYDDLESSTEDQKQTINKDTKKDEQHEPVEPVEPTSVYEANTSLDPPQEYSGLLNESNSGNDLNTQVANNITANSPFNAQQIYSTFYPISMMPPDKRKRLNCDAFGKRKITFDINSPSNSGEPESTSSMIFNRLREGAQAFGFGANVKRSRINYSYTPSAMEKCISGIITSTPKPVSSCLCGDVRCKCNCKLRDQPSVTEDSQDQIIE